MEKINYTPKKKYKPDLETRAEALYCEGKLRQAKALLRTRGREITREEAESLMLAKYAADEKRVQKKYVEFFSTVAVRNMQGY